MTTGPLVAGLGDNPSGHEAIVPMDDPRTVSMFSDVFDKVGQRGGGSAPAGYEQLAREVAARAQALAGYAGRDVVLMLDGREVARNTMGHVSALGVV